MTCEFFRPVIQRKSLIAALSAAFFAIAMPAMPVQSGEEVPEHNKAGEIKIRSEVLPPENASATRRFAERDHKAMHGKIDLPAGTEEPAAPALAITPSESLLAPLTEDATPSGKSAGTEAEKPGKRARPKPDQRYAGTSIGAAGVMSAPVAEEKKYSMQKRGETTRAYPVKDVIEHGDSPELQARNEKLRKIKEHFRGQLEQREERKQGKTDEPAPAEGVSK